jgi:DNA-binding LytR/AlgR family response regulator
LLATSLVGFFPAILYIFITERSANTQHKTVANTISSYKKTKPIGNNQNQDIYLQGENKNETLQINIENLIYISSEKNYASVFYFKDDQIKECLLRTSLAKIENQLAAHSQIIRCHKSYIINSKFVKEIKGNARGYFLEIHQLDLLIPVSRNFPKEMLFTLVQ